MTGRRTVTGVAVIGAVLVSACATGSADLADSAATATLRQDLHDVTSAAAGKDYRAALAALTRLTGDAADAHEAGRLSDARFARINATAARVRADLIAAITPRTPTTTRTVTVHPTAPESGKGKGDNKDGGGGGNKGGEKGGD